MIFFKANFKNILNIDGSKSGQGRPWFFFPKDAIEIYVQIKDLAIRNIRCYG